ncbi:MAG: excinuclease ABC subunit UvrA, partial [Candidatus Nealsonbacteria bacterium]|nr:excinuclease ABC subunit UvrA [Candidatus Nealsonbacteria bacterium]
MPENFIKIRGARVHNLKNVDVDIPKNKLVVITGLSGSGKSSLAFDTLYAEGQRRYVESLSPYARQFLGIMDKPDADSIEGISPAISIDQRKASHNPRSTVGTMTEIYDYLRLLFARIGKPHCPKCGKPISRQTIDQIVEQILNPSSGGAKNKEITILGPVIRQKKGEHQGILEEIKRAGFVRARIDGIIYLLEEALTKELDKNKKHNIEVVVDRLILDRDLDKSRMVDSLETALKLGKGIVMVNDSIFSENFACEACGISMQELEPRLFSFNSPFGACPGCQGLGEKLEVDPKLVLANPNLIYKYGQADIEGVIPWLERRYHETDSDFVRQEIEQYMLVKKCEICQGKRLKPEVLAVTIAGKSIDKIVEMPIYKLKEFCAGLKLKADEIKIANPIIKEIINRLQFLIDVGLDYLTLDRRADTLSGGEEQRIRLATQIGSKLTGVLYILDEPSVGLHPRDQGRLIETLKKLRNLGNSVIVVEHDPQTIRSSDWIIDVGPGAGKHGGKIIFEGTPSQLLKSHTLTGDYLS